MRERVLTERARLMRREQTGPEQRLWSALRGQRFEGVKFRRQKVIGRYIVDFSARNPMLVIEIDGDTHADRGRYDGERTAFLEALGYRVIRFANSDVMANLEGVLMTIASALSPLPTLSPEGERAS